MDVRTIIGYRRDGRPVFTIIGGSGQAGDGGGAGGGDGAGAGGSGKPEGENQPGSGTPGGGSSGGSGQPDGGENKGSAGAPPKGSDGNDFDADRAQRTIEALREDVKTEKTKREEYERKQAQQMDALARALGLKEDDQPTPEKLQQELGQRDTKITQLEDENRSLKLQIAVNAVASEKNVISDLLWAQLSASGKLKDVDLTAKNFSDQVGSLVDEELKRFPQLRKTPIGARDAGARGSSTPQTGDMNSIIRGAAGRA